MEKSILSTWVNPEKEPFEELQNLLNSVESIDLMDVGKKTRELNNSMVNFWNIYEALYNSYETEMIADQVSQGFKSNIEALNHIMVSQFKTLVEIVNSSALDVNYLRHYLERTLEEENLMSLYDRNNLVQSILQYGYHIILFKEQLSPRLLVEMEVNFPEGLENRMAGRKLGRATKEMAYKFSNEILIQSLSLQMISNKWASGKDQTDQISQRYLSTLFNLICAWGLHWSLLSADSLYIYEKTYQLLLHDNSTKV